MKSISIRQINLTSTSFMSAPDFVTIVATKSQVLSQDRSEILEVFQALTASPATARQYCERVDFAVDGYNNTRLELYEIPEVRGFIADLDTRFPFWLFFLSKHSPGLQCITRCLVPPYLTPRAEMEHLAQLLSGRWFPAMNHMCEKVGMSERQIEAMSTRVMDYLVADQQTHR
jgi:hypothetical protein